MPSRLVPRFFMNRFFTPPVKTDRLGRALVAPYPLRKVEAVLLKAGYDVWVVPPHKLEKTVGERTKIVGISVHDPLGIDPVSFKLSMIFGGGETWTARFFRELSDKVSSLKKKFRFKVIVGGPASWELVNENLDFIDLILVGEAESILPSLIEKLISGERLPRVVRSKSAKLEDIPPIVNPARLGEVQITRGCPRGCWFCSVTPETFRSIPIDIIKKEVEVNIRGGIRRVELITDDIMLYGSQALRVNHDAIVKLYTELASMNVEGIWFP
ncbi:MAG: radical SAM protein, partial [Sulfolobales archaeon]